jgi:hypothetical protein
VRYLALLLFSVAAFADRPVVFSWNHNYQQTNGTAIATNDLLVTVYNEFDQEACTGATSCEITQPWDTCVTYYAVATQLSTGMQSEPSSGVASCTGPLPVYDTPPTAPVLEVQLN